MRHARTRPLVTLALLVALAGVGCTTRTDVAGPADAVGVRHVARVRDCDGAPTGLPPALRAALPQRSGGLTTMDDVWAELARTTPGGFAGVLYDDGRAVLLLTDPSQAAAARAALAPHLPGFGVAGAVIRRARWDFAQLADWYAYLLSHAPLWQEGGITFADKDEAVNRLVLGAVDETARDRLVARLATLDLPCDLVLVEVREPATILVDR